MDVVSAWSMFCADYPLPDNFLLVLEGNTKLDPYWLTHVAYQLQNIITNDCWENKDELTAMKNRIITDLANMIEEDNEDYLYNADVKVEAIVMLMYLGGYDKMKPSFMKWIIDSQLNDGGWSISPEYETTDHISMLAFWALLQYRQWLVENEDAGK